MDRPSASNDYQAAHVRLLLSSFRHFVGRDLLADAADDVALAQRLFEADFVLVSHDALPDPVLSYGNAAALRLWETDWESLTAMPSRKTAEPAHRDERARLLRATEEHGFIDDYAGIRISATGRRFRIENAIIWNLVDATGARVGQAAMFKDVEFL